jgi:uncharacterized damage-inducible protein DinB
MSLSRPIFLRLQHQHEVISSLIDGLSEEQVKVRVNPEKWSAFENIVHLAAYQPTFIHRAKQIINDEQPSFQAYRAENDPLFYEYLKKNLKELLQDVNLNRNLILSQLEGLDEHHLNRWGIHPKFGKMTMSEWTEFFLLHEAHHLFTIFALTRQLRS